MESPALKPVPFWSAIPLAVVVLCGRSLAQVTERESVSSSGAQGNLDSRRASVSGDGRFVVFQSAASTLVAGDTNNRIDIFVRDRIRGVTERVSVSTAGIQGNGDCSDPVMSPDGRYVTFTSEATNLTSSDTTFGSDVFLHDRATGVTEMVSLRADGLQGDDSSGSPSISPDGRFVAFSSRSTNLVPFDTNGTYDVFVRDRLLRTTECVSVAPNGRPGNGPSGTPVISADGRYVAFNSGCTDLVPGDSNDRVDLFVRDRDLDSTLRVSIGPGNVEGNGDSGLPAITPDGRFIAFSSTASNLVPGDTNNHADVFVVDRLLGTLERASLTYTGGQATDSSAEASISADGRYVAWHSIAQDFVAGDNNGGMDVFLRDRASGTTERVSLTSGGSQANGQSYSAALSGDGRFVVFDSTATNLAPGDTNGQYDVFLRDRTADGFASLCGAGQDGVVACPCGNPPAHAGQGCNNSSATGGAVLSASGAAYLSLDGLSFATTGEGPSALSIVVQGNGGVPGGAVCGQGVRCLGGSVIRRLFIKHAVGGSILAPDPGAGDLSVSAKSAALGDIIHAGERRWYFVYYRDAVVLGTCPGTSTFNVTQTGRVSWSL